MKPVRVRPDPRKSLVGFLVGDVHYAVDISRVSQVIKPVPITAMPHVPEGLIGVVDYRGDIVPVLDLRIRFGLPPLVETRHVKWILLNARSYCLALVVDDITEVFGLESSAIRPAPGLEGNMHAAVIGALSHAGRLTFVLDVERFRDAVVAFASSAPAVSLSPQALGGGTRNT